MFCNNCGKEIDDKAVVCVGCGVPVVAKDKALDPINGKAVAASGGGGILALGIIALCSAVLTAIFVFIPTLSLLGLLFLIASLATGITVFALGRKGKYRALSIAAFVVSIVFAALYLLFLIIGIAIIGSLFKFK